MPNQTANTTPESNRSPLVLGFVLIPVMLLAAIGIAIAVGRYIRKRRRLSSLDSTNFYERFYKWKSSRIMELEMRFVLVLNGPRISGETQQVRCDRKWLENLRNKLVPIYSYDPSEDQHNVEEEIDGNGEMKDNCELSAENGTRQNVDHPSISDTGIGNQETGALNEKYILKTENGQ
ncbi:uncharacterized protein [Narcine bancroftii]|uniref:uncharacterized protein isoform X1 n=1 Tax=Narcine bancroftii TaxID=1343680 RepID=UPI0038322AF7